MITTWGCWGWMSYLTLFPSGKPLEGRAVSYYPERPARTFLGWVCGQGLNDARLCASSCRTGCLLVLEMNVFFVNRMNTPSYSPHKVQFLHPHPFFRAVDKYLSWRFMLSYHFRYHQCHPIYFSLFQWYVCCYLSQCAGENIELHPVELCRSSRLSLVPLGLAPLGTGVPRKGRDNHLQGTYSQHTWHSTNQVNI